jgi:hypothetical protein
VVLHPLNQVLRHWTGYKKLQFLLRCQGVFPGFVPVQIHVIHIQGEKVEFAMVWLQTVWSIRFPPLEHLLLDGSQGVCAHATDPDKNLMVHLLVLLFCFPVSPSASPLGDCAVFGIFSKINIQYFFQ